MLGVRLLRHIGASGSFPTEDDAVGLGWFNVKTYGAKGDGATDDTSSINTAIAAFNSAGKGVLYFPAGTYLVSSGLSTITASGIVAGDGMGAYDRSVYVTAILCSSATAVVFTVTANALKFADLGIFNTYVGTPSAGAAIQASGSFIGQKTDYDSILVSGFYINVDVQVGAQWAMRNCWIVKPVLYGVKIRNTVNPDAGDWAISDSYFYSRDYSATAGIRQESSGGGKIVNCKFNSWADLAHMFTYQYQYVGGGDTSVLCISNSSFENYSHSAIHLDANGYSFGAVTISAVEIGGWESSSGYGVYTDEVDNIAIFGLVGQGDASSTFVSLNNGAHGAVGPMTNDGWGTLLATSSFTDLVDHTT